MASRYFHQFGPSPPKPIQNLWLRYDESRSNISFTDDENDPVEDVLTIKIPSEYIQDFRSAYFRARKIPTVVNLLYANSKKNLLLLEGLTRNLSELVRNKTEKEFFFYQIAVVRGRRLFQLHFFSPLLIEIIQKLIITFNFLSQDSFFRYVSTTAKNIVFFSSDTRFENPKIVLEKTPTFPAEDIKGKSIESTSTHRSSFHSLGMILEEIIQNSAIKKEDIHPAVHDFIFLLVGEGESDLGRVRNHPALWFARTSLRYMVDAMQHIEAVRSTTQIELDTMSFEKGRGRAARHPLYLCFPKAMMKFNYRGPFEGKYSGWIAVIENHTYLNDFYQQSVRLENGSYSDDLDGLFRFIRNALVHFYDQSGPCMEKPQFIKRIKIEFAEVERWINQLFPEFYVHVYGAMYQIGFRYNGFPASYVAEVV